MYALLREALRKSNKVGVAKVVIQSKQHLAVLIPCGRALVLNLPPLDAKAADIKDAEMAMAVQLIEDMTQPWDADSFRNSFAQEIGKLVEAKASSGEIAQVAKVGEGAAAPAGAQVIHLATLLKRSHVRHGCHAVFQGGFGIGDATATAGEARPRESRQVHQPARGAGQISNSP